MRFMKDVVVDEFGNKRCRVCGTTYYGPKCYKECHHKDIRIDFTQYEQQIDISIYCFDCGQELISVMGRDWIEKQTFSIVD